MSAKTKTTKTTKLSPAIPANCEAMMSRADIAAALRVSVRHLDAMIGVEEYPKPDTHLGRAPRWRRETHDRWVRQRCGAEG